MCVRFLYCDAGTLFFEAMICNLSIQCWHVFTVYIGLFYRRIDRTPRYILLFRLINMKFVLTTKFRKRIMHSTTNREIAGLNPVTDNGIFSFVQILFLWKFFSIDKKYLSHKFQFFFHFPYHA